MNKHNKSLGKRSTNTASLSNAISSIKTSISPVIFTGATSNNPKPIKIGGQVWIRRKVREHLTQNISAESVDGKISDLFTLAGITGQIRILGLKVWNYTGPGTTTQYVKVTTPVSLTETAVSTGVQDIGSGSHLPGVHVVIPRTIASNLVTSSAVYVTVSGSSTGTITQPQTFAVDVDFEYKTSVSN